MLWWSWLLIWAGLVLGLLGMLVWFAFRLFRKFMAASDALVALADQVADSMPDDSSDASNEDSRGNLPAIFQDVGELSFQRARRRAERAHRRQESRDRRINRGKVVSHTPSNQRTVPHA